MLLLIHCVLLLSLCVCVGGGGEGVFSLICDIVIGVLSSFAVV